MNVEGCPHREQQHNVHTHIIGMQLTHTAQLLLPHPRRRISTGNPIARGVWGAWWIDWVDGYLIKRDETMDVAQKGIDVASAAPFQLSAFDSHVAVAELTKKKGGMKEIRNRVEVGGPKEKHRGGGYRWMGLAKVGRRNQGKCAAGKSRHESGQYQPSRRIILQS